MSRTAASDIGDDIFLSDDDDLEEEEREREKKILSNNNNNTMQCARLSEENLALRRENDKLKEKMLAERRLYEEYQEELRRENQILEANLELLELIKSREMERSLQALKSDLEEKDGKLKKNTETIQELNKLVRQERKNSAVLRGLIVEEMITESSVKSDEKQVQGKQHDTIVDVKSFVDSSSGLGEIFAFFVYFFYQMGWGGKIKLINHQCKCCGALLLWFDHLESPMNTNILCLQVFL